jgi:glycosyltransferase involved in cell wall biosynthesis
LLLHALASCFAQDYRPLEIDVRDDSISDDSESLVSSLTVPEGISLRYSRNSHNLGQAGNVNELFMNARGSRLVLLHDDDLLTPGSVTAMDQAWREQPNTLAVFGMQQILQHGGEVDLAETESQAVYNRRDRAHVGIQNNILVSALWRQFPNNGYLIDTQAARAAGYRPFEEIGHACDTDFSIRLAIREKGKIFSFIDRYTSQYRYNVASLSRSIDVNWRLYEVLIGLTGLTPAEIDARDDLLKKIAAQATKENALHRRRRAALRIFLSRYYPHNENFLKSLYHFGLIVSPRTNFLRNVFEFGTTWGLLMLLVTGTHL